MRIEIGNTSLYENKGGTVFVFPQEIPKNEISPDFVIKEVFFSEYILILKIYYMQFPI